MRPSLLTALVVLTAFPALAQETPAYCRLLPQHKAPTGVEYVPGVDVHGKSVVPADLNSSLNIVNKAIVIPIEVDLAQRFGTALPGGVELKPAAGSMTVHADGRVSYGDQDITPEAYALCGTEPPVVLIPPEPAKPAPVQPPSQPAADAVPSKPQPGEVIEGQYP